MRNLFLPLTKLADGLDRMDLPAEADQVDMIIQEAAILPSMGEWIRKKYDKLRTIFDRRRQDRASEKEYENKASERLDDMLRRKEMGSPEERIFFWYCHRGRASCAQCRKRHGRMRTMRQWRAEGMPGPAVCAKTKCSCYLIPLRPGGAAPEGVAQLSDDSDTAAGIIGLRQDNSAENMQQGFALMPFWSNSGGLF